MLDMNTNSAWFYTLNVCQIDSYFEKPISKKMSIIIPSQYVTNLFELPHDKTNKMICAPSEDSDQPGHPRSLISLSSVGSVVAQG